MYIRSPYAEEDLPSLRSFIRANPLGIFTTAIDSPDHPFIQSTHLPFLLDVKDENSQTELGILRGHMARANPQSKALIEHLTSSAADVEKNSPGKLERDVLVLFNHPIQHYVTPKFYHETKPKTEKVAPTWNYAAVQVYGKLTVYFDSKSDATKDFLAKQLADLAMMGERDIMKYEDPWVVEDAPRPWVEILKKAIIGLEIEVTSIAGKWKMSQELPKGDREGVIYGFRELNTDAAKQMSKIVEERGEISDRQKEVQK